MRGLNVGMAGLAIAAVAAFAPMQAAALASFSVNASLALNFSAPTGGFSVNVTAPHGSPNGIGTGFFTPQLSTGSPDVNVSIDAPASSSFAGTAGQALMVSPFQIVYTGVGNPGDSWVDSAHYTILVSITSDVAQNISVGQFWGGQAETSTTLDGETASASLIQIRRWGAQNYPNGGSALLSGAVESSSADGVNASPLVFHSGQPGGFAPVSFNRDFTAGQTRDFIFRIDMGGALFSPALNPAPEETAVPVPAALPLMGAALLGLGLVARRRRKAA